MEKHFKDIFNRQPNFIINNDHFFNSDRDGDCFDESDSEIWFQEDIFKKKWDLDFILSNELFNFFYEYILKIFEQHPYPFMEVACGPGMGLTPLILTKNPQIPCLATDACSLLIKSWREYINDSLSQYKIALASFSVMDIPLKSESMDIVTSFIGIGSTRSGEEGRMKALSEIHRVLKKGGFFITIENEWTDLREIEKVFKLWGRPIWPNIPESLKKTWQERFNECGFIIESCDKVFYQNFTKDDNELGEQADKLGIKVGLKYTLFILRKY